MTYVDCEKCRVNAFMEKLCDPVFCHKFSKEGTSDDFTEAIEEVIHCKDCVFEEESRGWQKWCHKHERNVIDGDFCSWAERKEE